MLYGKVAFVIRLFPLCPGYVITVSALTPHVAASSDHQFIDGFMIRALYFVDIEPLGILIDF